MNYSTLGKRIKQARILNGLTQQQLAERLQVTPSHLSHIETGAAKISLETLYNVVKVLNVSFDTLLIAQTEVGLDSFTPQLLKIFHGYTPKDVKLITDFIVNLQNQAQEQ